MVTKDSLLFLFVVCVQAIFVRAGPPDWVPPEVIEMVQDDKNRCMGEHGTTEAQIDEVNSGVLKNDRSISCYMYCLLEAFALADEEGNIDSDMMLGLLPDNLQEMAVDVMGKCLPQDGADNCDKIFNIAKCIQSTVPEMWFLV